MLVIWSNCNSMMSLSITSQFGTNRRKGDGTLDGFKNARKLDVGIMISCPEDEFKVY